jgi:hypothetical protein
MTKSDLTPEDISFILGYIQDMAIDRLGNDEDKIFAFTMATLISLYASQVASFVDQKDWPHILKLFTHRIEYQMERYVKNHPEEFD